MMLPARFRLCVIVMLCTGSVARSEQAERKSVHAVVQNGACAPPLVAPITGDERTKILVLATPHLEALGSEFDPAALKLLLDALVRFKPDIVGVEAMPPDVIGAMQLRHEVFQPVIEQFAETRVTLGRRAQEILKLNWEQAWDKTKTRFFSAPAVNDRSMSDDLRLKLVLELLAAYDLYGAVLQWSYVAESSREANTAVPRDIAEELDRELASSNEIVAIGVRTAVRLGLGRIDYIDDFTVGPILIGIGRELSQELEGHPALRGVATASVYTESSDRQKKALTAGDMLPYYVFLNSPVYGDRDVDAQWNVFFRTQLKSGLDRTRVAVWELRNLQMVHHIRRATAFAPGGRMLVIVGAGHKPFLDRYLCQLIDVEVVHLGDVVAVRAP